MLTFLVLLHLLRHRRFVFYREYVLYSLFVGYMLIALVWTPNIDLVESPLASALDCVLILILFGSLVTYYDLHAVLAGSLCGFLTGAVIYAYISGFPFVRPEGFSYNTFGLMYSFGLFLTLAYGWHKRSALLPVALGFVIFLNILATTSIKTNLGILLGMTLAALVYFGVFVKALRRNIILFVALAGMLVITLASQEGLVDRLNEGVKRVSLIVNILEARGADVPGYSGVQERKEWKDEGLKGFAGNPIFGHGVEAFRNRFEITSHSTPVDVLYDTGLIGFVLFYGVFVSMAWRLFRADDKNDESLRALIFGALVCYVFITLTGTMHYNTFLAAFVGISVALLARHRVHRLPVKGSA